MAKGKKAVGKPFEPGVSGNEKGRPVLDYNTAEARQYTRTQVLNAMHEAMRMPVVDLIKYLTPTDKELGYKSGAEALMASILAKGIVFGCERKAQFFMSYLFGRPVEYDPTEDVAKDPGKTKVEAVNSDVLVRVMREAEKAKATAGG